MLFEGKLALGPLTGHRRKFVECVDVIKNKPESLFQPPYGGPLRPEDAALISVVKPPVALQDSCDYR